MFLKPIKISVITALSLLLVMPAFAQDVKKEDKKEEPKEITTPVTEWVAAENKLIATLSEKDKETFFIVRNKHSVVRSLRLVRDDIGNAVKGCGKENPDLKKDMDARFKDWQDAVMPILKEADKFLKEEIDSQKVVYPSDFKYVLKLNDKAYEYGNSKMDKRVLTDEKSCNKLMESMDRSENELITLLQEILLPEEVVRERLEQQRKNEEAEASSSKS